MEKLSLLAVQLTKCRRRGNKLTLECILESARILSEAKAIAHRGFGIWLAQEAHMDRSTAGRHLRVAKFARQNGALMHQIATLSLAKIYALAGLDSAVAVKLLTGQIKLSSPIELISDVEFRRNLRAIATPRAPRHTRHHVYQAASSALTRARTAVAQATEFLKSMTAVQRHKLEGQIQALVRQIAGWKGVA